MPNLGQPLALTQFQHQRSEYTNTCTNPRTCTQWHQEIMKKTDEHVLQLSDAKTAKEGIDLIQLKFIMVITVVVIFMIKLTGLIWVCVNVCGCGVQGIQRHIIVVFCTCIKISCCSCWVSNPWPPSESDAPPLNYPHPLIISITTVATAERGCRSASARWCTDQLISFIA